MSGLEHVQQSERCRETRELFPAIEELGTVMGVVLLNGQHVRQRVPVVLEVSTLSNGVVFYTPKGPTIGGRDFKKRGFAIRFAKKVYEHPSNEAEWYV